MRLDSHRVGYFYRLVMQRKAVRRVFFLCSSAGSRPLRKAHFSVCGSAADCPVSFRHGQNRHPEKAHFFWTAEWASKRQPQKSTLFFWTAFYTAAGVKREKHTFFSVARAAFFILPALVHTADSFRPHGLILIVHTATLHRRVRSIAAPHRKNVNLHFRSVRNDKKMCFSKSVHLHFREQ